MDRAEAEARMREVQRIMERTTLYTLLPGAAAVIGGVLVLLGCAVSYAMIRSVDFRDVICQSIQTQWVFCFMWTAIGVGAFAIEVVLTTRAARRQGLSPTARPARFAAFSLSPSVFVAAILTVKLMIDMQVIYVVPVWMMCYGTGVYTAGLFSVRLPRLLGIAFILLGAIALLCFPDYGLVFAALSFGLLHIAFGLTVIARSRRSTEA
jgi:hypothetical protein